MFHVEHTLQTRRREQAGAARRPSRQQRPPKAPLCALARSAGRCCKVGAIAAGAQHEGDAKACGGGLPPPLAADCWGGLPPPLAGIFLPTPTYFINTWPRLSSLMYDI